MIHFVPAKESWLLNGLFDYYLTTNSARAIELLVSVREPHDKYLFDKLCESLKNPGTKLQALTVLGHVLRRQPAWLYKITQHQLLKDLLKLLKVYFLQPYTFCFVLNIHAETSVPLVCL